MYSHLYHLHIHWNSDRKGAMRSPELHTDANHCRDLATPPEFPKGIPGIWSPEH